jgi:hypothetical protein
MAKDFPKAKVIGIDIQDQVDRSKLPPNAQFQQVDLLAPEGKCLCKNVRLSDELIRLCFIIIRLTIQRRLL